jgi:RHS repeat-associated protein
VNKKFEVDILSASNFTSFGFCMSGRKLLIPSYRYAFSGQEKNDEMIGDGNYLDFLYRGYDPRLGRFFSVDPLTSEYPELTPYQFASNNPIGNFEIEGLEGRPVNPNTYGSPAPTPGLQLQLPINTTVAGKIANKAVNPGFVINRAPQPKDCRTGACSNTKLNQRLVFDPNYVDGASGYSIGRYGLETAQLVSNISSNRSRVIGQPNVASTQANDLGAANISIAAAQRQVQANQAAGNILPSATNGAPGTIANSYESIIDIEILPVNLGGIKLGDAQVLQANLQAANPRAQVNIRQLAANSRSGIAYGSGELGVTVNIVTPSF